MFEKIVLAVDGSEHSKRAVPVAADLAQKYGGEVIAVHVREREVSRAGAVDFETTEEGQEIVDEAVRALKDVGASARGESWGTIYGRAAAEIVKVAADEGAGIIVMGTRGLTDLKGLLVGSVTHKVLHLAECPVLVVR